MKEFTLKPNGAEAGEMTTFPVDKVIIDRDSETKIDFLLLILKAKNHIDGQRILRKLEAVQMAVNVGNEVSESERYMVVEQSKQELKVTGNLQLAVTNLRKFKLIHSEDERAINGYLDSLDHTPKAKSARIL